ncbi:uncharacterized protein At4g18490 isoform X3 [Primulina tabacum]|uniref:uncharacterized protein At4g18490 isoform X3 n=1 Tax=Primulina tabacum TaxID=48773 RepID=UPI003F5AC8CB
MMFRYITCIICLRLFVRTPDYIKMAECQKNASSSVNFKEKNLLLDLDIGKDFLSSWKSMSVAEEDVMDFDFTPISKGKEKIFSFDKVDVDFNLHGDFGKISSFNMDDLDISSPPGKDPKFKEKLEVVSSSGDVKGKSDRFTFAFDFNELESFNFEPNLEKGPNARENKDNFENSPNESGCQDKGDTSNMNIFENTSTLDEEPKKPSVPGTAIGFDVDCQVDTADSELSGKNCPSLLATGYSGISNLSITTEEGAPCRANTSSEPAIATRSQPKISQTEKLISPDRIALEACAGKNAIPDLSSNTLSNNGPSFGISTDLLDKVGLTCSIGEQDANVPSISTSSFMECLTSESMYQPQRAAISEKKNGEKIQEGIEIHVKGSKKSTEIGQVVSLVEKSCLTSVIPGQFSNIQTSNEDQTTTSVIQKLVSVSQAVDNPISEKEIRPHEACSMSLLQTVKAECNVQKTSSTKTRVSLLSCKKMGLTQSSLIDGTRDLDSISSDRKLALPSLEHLKTSRRELALPQTRSQESYKGPKISIEGPHAVGVNHERKIKTSSTTHDTEAVKLKSFLRQREESMRGLDTLRKSSQNNANTTLSSEIASLPAIKDNPAKEDKILAVEGGLRNSDLHGQKTSSLNLDSSESSILKGANTLAKSGKTYDVSRKMAATIAHFADTPKRTLGTLSLKRKTMEECKTVFSMASPPKRLSPSSKERRNFAETSELVPDKQVSNHDIKEGDHCIESSSANSQISTWDTSHKVNFKGLETSFSMENDTNIRQAEAYSKELDNICNTLRKKHEEAKEILVRSIVNSNKLLLLLNHPLRNKKISF